MSAKHPQNMDSQALCKQDVTHQDPDRAMLIRFCPEDSQRALYAVHAFNLELAKTREVISEAMLGEIRLQWWREAVEELFTGTPRKHHVLDELAVVMADKPLPRAPFDALIDSRAADLYDDRFQTLTDLEAYAAKTASPLMTLTLEALGVDAAAHEAQAAKVATAFALVGLVRAVPFHAHHRRCYLPAEFVPNAEVVFAGKIDGGPKAACASMLGRAGELLREARKEKAPKQVAPALRLAKLAEHYIKHMAKSGLDPFRMPEDNKGRLQLAMAWAALRRKW